MSQQAAGNRQHNRGRPEKHDKDLDKTALISAVESTKHPSAALYAQNEPFS